MDKVGRIRMNKPISIIKSGDKVNIELFGSTAPANLINIMSLFSFEYLFGEFFSDRDIPNGYWGDHERLVKQYIDYNRRGHKIIRVCVPRSALSLFINLTDALQTTISGTIGEATDWDEYLNTHQVCGSPLTFVWNDNYSSCITFDRKLYSPQKLITEIQSLHWIEENV